MRSTCIRGLASRRSQTLILLLMVFFLVLLLELHHERCLYGNQAWPGLYSGLSGQGLPLKSDKQLHVSDGVDSASDNGGRLEKEKTIKHGSSPIAIGNSKLHWKHDQPVFKRTNESWKLLEAEEKSLLGAIGVSLTMGPLSNDPIFVNISRLGKKKALFASVPDELYLLQNKSVFSENSSTNNVLNYKLLIDGSRICADGQQVFILIIIPSVAGDIEMRNAIRRTWLGTTERELWPHGTKIKADVRHIFLLGMVSGIDLTSLHAESKLHGDLVLADFQDSYRNLTTKVLVGMQWARQFCQQTQLVLKVDQDTLINMPLMTQLLSHVLWMTQGRPFVLGLRHFVPKPKVRRKGKWGVSVSDYPLSTFPAYLYGHTYAISAPTGLDMLLKSARHVPMIPPEDAYLTGILPKVAGVVRLTSRAFTVCCRRNMSFCEVVWNQKVAFTGLDSPALLDTMWASTVLRICDPRLSLYDMQLKKKPDKSSKQTKP